LTISFHQSIVCPILIGRDAELTALRNCLEAPLQAQGGVVFLSGEAGIGKSRLVSELKRYAETQDFQLFEGQCFPTDRAYPYAPLLDLLDTFLTPLSPSQIVAALDTSARVLFPVLPEQIQHLPELANLSPLFPVEPEQEQRRLFTSLADIFLRAATTQPLLLVIEDLHWSDENTFEFLLFFTRKIAEQRILVVLTYRDDEMSQPLRSLLAQLDRERQRQEVVLEPLNRSNTETFLLTILQESHSLPVGMLDALFDLTEGNPFFLEEVLKALIVAKELVEREDGWRWKRADTWHIPLSLHNAVELRLTRLSTDTRRVLELASVAGRRFDFALLQKITGFDETYLVELMKEAINAQLVIEESAEQFAFRHALTQQAIASGLLVRERRALHATIARTIERLYTSSPDAHLADLAYHCAEAELWNETVIYATRAAEQAQALSAPRAAIVQWTRVINAVEQLGQSAPSIYYLSRGQAYEVLGVFEQALADYERALGCAREEQEGHLEWQCLQNLGFLWTSRDYQRAGTYFQQTVEMAVQLGDDNLRAHSLNRLGNWLLNTGQGDQALAAHQQALSLFEALHDQSGMAETLDLLGMVYQLVDDPVNAVLMYGRAIELLRIVGKRSVLCSCLTMRPAASTLWSGDTSCSAKWGKAECERDLKEAMHLARELEWAAGEASVEIILGAMLACFGQFGAGLTHINQGLRLATEINHQEWMALALNGLARVYSFLLAPEIALAKAESGLEISRTLGSAIWITHFITSQVQAYMALGQPKLAEQALQEVRSAVENPRQVAERQLLLVWAELALAQQRPELALQRCEQLLSTAPQRAGSTPELVIPRLWKCQGEALAALGRKEEAILMLEEARRGAILQQYLPLLWQIERSLGRAYQRQRRLEQAQQMFASARQGIALLAESIDDQALREHFEYSAYKTLPKQKPISARQASSNEYDGLSEREREVAALIGEGKSNAEIAGMLVVSKRTIETYVSRVLSKLGLTSRSQIALWTRDKGLVSHTR
jgi:DNA-binding CsgD family transcriptional regulator